MKLTATSPNFVGQGYDKLLSYQVESGGIYQDAGLLQHRDCHQRAS